MLIDEFMICEIFVVQSNTDKRCTEMLRDFFLKQYYVLLDKCDMRRGCVDCVIMRITIQSRVKYKMLYTTSQ